MDRSSRGFDARRVVSAPSQARTPWIAEQTWRCAARTYAQSRNSTSMLVKESILFWHGGQRMVPNPKNANRNACCEIRNIGGVNGPLAANTKVNGVMPYFGH